MTKLTIPKKKIISYYTSDYGKNLFDITDDYLIIDINTIQSIIAVETAETAKKYGRKQIISLTIIIDDREHEIDLDLSLFDICLLIGDS